MAFRYIFISCSYYSSRFASKTARTQGIGQRGKKQAYLAAQPKADWGKTWPSLALSWAEQEATWLAPTTDQLARKWAPPAEAAPDWQIGLLVSLAAKLQYQPRLGILGAGGFLEGVSKVGEHLLQQICSGHRLRRVNLIHQKCRFPSATLRQPERRYPWYVYTLYFLCTWWVIHLRSRLYPWLSAVG